MTTVIGTIRSSRCFDILYWLFHLSADGFSIVRYYFGVNCSWTKFSHIASVSVLGSSRCPNLRWGMLCGYPPLTRVTWAGPLAGTCGGGLARTPYETINVIELVTLLHPGGARHPPGFIRMRWSTGPSSHRCLQHALPKQHIPSRLTILRLLHWCGDGDE